MKDLRTRVSAKQSGVYKHPVPVPGKEMDVIRAIVEARTSQNMTQKELSKRTGINQADISKLENGTGNPTINLLKRLADGMGMMLKIEFVPKTKQTKEFIVPDTRS